jgi:hypothetical protein
MPLATTPAGFLCDSALSAERAPAQREPSLERRKEQAAIAKERDATTEARAQEAAKRAVQTDPAVAAAAVGEFMDSLKVMLERIFSAPVAPLRSLLEGSDRSQCRAAVRGGRVLPIAASLVRQGSSRCYADQERACKRCPVTRYDAKAAPGKGWRTWDRKPKRWWGQQKG